MAKQFEPIMGHITNLGELFEGFRYSAYEIPERVPENYDFNLLPRKKFEGYMSLTVFTGDREKDNLSFISKKTPVGYYQVSLSHHFMGKLKQEAIDALLPYTMEGTLGGLRIERRSDDHGIANVCISDGTVVNRILATIPVEIIPDLRDVDENMVWVDKHNLLGNPPAMKM